MDGSYACAEHSRMYRVVKSLCYTTETNVTCVSTILQFKKMSCHNNKITETRENVIKQIRDNLRGLNEDLELKLDFRKPTVSTSLATGTTLKTSALKKFYRNVL